MLKSLIKNYGNYLIKKQNKNPNLLGRWIVENDSKRIDKKFDQSNEDHCGCCEIAQPLESTKQIKEIDITDDYIKPFFY